MSHPDPQTAIYCETLARRCFTSPKKNGSQKDLKPRGIKSGSQEAARVKGGKVAMQDFHFVKKTDKASA